MSCAKVVSGAQVCADYFGAWTEELVRPQCEISQGTVCLAPCVLPDRFATCVYYAAAAPDYCYMEHIRGDAAAEAFWESTCPAAGGSWQPN